MLYLAWEDFIFVSLDLYLFPLWLIRNIPRTAGLDSFMDLAIHCYDSLLGRHQPDSFFVPLVPLAIAASVWR